jgi:hypothetical protein
MKEKRINMSKFRNFLNTGLINTIFKPSKVQKALGKPEGKRTFGKPRRRWKIGIRMDVMEIGWGVV